MNLIRNRLPWFVRAAGGWRRAALAALVAATVTGSSGAAAPSPLFFAEEGPHHGATTPVRTVIVTGPIAMASAALSADSSEGALAVAAKVQAALNAADDVEQTIRMEIINPANGHVQRAAGRLQARLPNLFRIDFTEPDMLAGVAVVVDVVRNRAWQYQPVTEQIIVQPWDELARERGVEFELDTWLGFPDPERFRLRRGDDVSIDGTAYILLEGRPRQPSSAARYEFLVHPERWWVEGLRLYDASENLIFSALIDDVTLNQGLDEDHLQAFPPGAETIYR